MKIFKHQMTEKLPETVSECEGKVFMVFDDGRRFPINENETAMRLFKKMWSGDNCTGVELICDNPLDNLKFCRILSICRTVYYE